MPRCLESLEGVANEVLVVDSFSSDATIELANRHGAKVAEVKAYVRDHQCNVELGIDKVLRIRVWRLRNT